MQHFGVIDTGLHSSHKVVIFRLELFDISLQLLSILQQILMLLPQLHSILRILQLLHNMVILCLQPRVFLIHHTDTLILIHIVMGHRTTLQLRIVMRQ